MSRKAIIAVIGAGSATTADVASARELGRSIAERGWILVTGGRDAGVMKAANEGAKEVEGSITIGILPNPDIPVCPAVDVPIITDLGEARNNVIVLSADITIACSINDPGTASEVALALKAKKPVILLGAGMSALDFFGTMGKGLIHVAASALEACQMAEQLSKRRF